MSKPKEETSTPDATGSSAELPVVVSHPVSGLTYEVSPDQARKIVEQFNQAIGSN